MVKSPLKSQKESMAEQDFAKAKSVFQLAKSKWMNLEIGGRATTAELQAGYEDWKTAKVIFQAAEKDYYAAIPSGEEGSEVAPSPNTEASQVDAS
jgi:hypothetical protein